MGVGWEGGPRERDYMLYDWFTLLHWKYLLIDALSDQTWKYPLHPHSFAIEYTLSTYVFQNSCPTIILSSLKNHDNLLKKKKSEHIPPPQLKDLQWLPFHLELNSVIAVA